MRTKSILGTLIALIALGVVVFNLPSAPYSPLAQTDNFPASTSTSKPSFQPITVSTPVPTSPFLANSSQTEATSSGIPTPTVTVSVGEKRYSVAIQQDTNVLGAMRALASTSDFTFTGRDYPSLGFFVESINGKKNADGLYWFLYINRKSSDTGVSQTHLSLGDTVEWRYEKNY